LAFAADDSRNMAFAGNNARNMAFPCNNAGTLAFDRYTRNLAVTTSNCRRYTGGLAIVTADGHHTGHNHTAGGGG
jgi:hypothetical protein